MRHKISICNNMSKTYMQRKEDNSLHIQTHRPSPVNQQFWHPMPNTDKLFTVIAKVLKIFCVLVLIYVCFYSIRILSGNLGRTHTKKSFFTLVTGLILTCFVQSTSYSIY